LSTHWAAQFYEKWGLRPLEQTSRFSAGNPSPYVVVDRAEMSLQGSSCFVDHVPAQFTKVAGMFNFDMVGEGEGAGCSLSPDPEELRRALDKADSHVGVLRRTQFFRGVVVRGSDFAPFYQAGIPCISFASNGPPPGLSSHKGYNLPHQSRHHGRHRQTRLFSGILLGRPLSYYKYKRGHTFVSTA
jgi:hypothetical protein